MQQVYAFLHQQFMLSYSYFVHIQYFYDQGLCRK